MEPKGHYWVGAVHSKFADAADWRQWADREIEKSDSPPYWVIALSLATSEDEVRQSLAEQLGAEVREAARTIYYSDASLGYIYWRYKVSVLSARVDEASQAAVATRGPGHRRRFFARTRGARITRRPLRRPFRLCL